MTAACTSNVVYVPATTVTATAIKRATATNAVTTNEKKIGELSKFKNLEIQD